MGLPKTEQPIADLADQILGYLNFSSGNHDPRFFSNLNSLFAQVSNVVDETIRTSEQNGKVLPSAGEQIIGRITEQLTTRLDELAKQNDAFRDSKQARLALELTLNHLLPAYRNHHRDLLFHQPSELLFNSHFVARAFESVLARIHPALELTPNPSELSDEHLDELFDVTLTPAMQQMNDFIGHRPVATLESQKIEPYEHEWVRPIPVFISEVGIAHGRYQELIEIALEILNETNPAILRAAYFSCERLEELAIDPRAFDFDHPINKRPNHHFGQWDEHKVGQTGHFKRFILQQVTLDALLNRVDSATTGIESEGAPDRDELIFEAAAVLAGTMLMASGISGDGPGAHHSTVTLGDLLPSIAEYRDQFYLELLDRLPEKHQTRLRAEMETRRQPFGAARQDLNARLANRRAKQLVNCRLASIFARMGYPDAAREQSNIVPVAGARIICQIDCLLSSASQLLDERTSDSANSDHLTEAFVQIPRAFELVKRGIGCGAIVDPWNILGFDANYSLFPAIENSVKDHRVYELVDLMERIFAVCSRLWSEAAAHDRVDVCKDIKDKFREIADWWRKYAPHEVMAVDAVDADDIYNAAELVAKALNLWHKGGAAAGDLVFWSQHAELFDSPKAYDLVVDALMQRGDHKTSTALLIHWLTQADTIPLQQGDSSFHQLLGRWIYRQKELLGEPDVESEAIWNRIRKFYDYIEANAEHYWEVPRFLLGKDAPLQDFDGELEEELQPDDDSSDSLFKAAYENVSYVDTTDDGMDGPIFDGSLTEDDDLEAEVDRILNRLEFQATMANYWRVAATVPLPEVNRDEPSEEVCNRLQRRREILSGWVSQALKNRSRIIDLLQSVHQYPLPTSGVDHDSMVQYDRYRLFKESLLDRAIETCVQTENAVRLLLAVVKAVNYLIDKTELGCEESSHDEVAESKSPLVTVFAAALLRKPKCIVEQFPDLLEYLNEQPLLYVPLSKGGDPASIVKARVVQTAMSELLATLPALGLFVETHELTIAALSMERNHPIRQGAVTEFDELFHVAYSSMIHNLIESTGKFKEQLVEEGEEPEKDIDYQCENILFDCIESLTESMLIPWLDHSRTLRLSVLEKVVDKKSWERLVEFVERYGEGLFTQRFLHLANVRAILHQGVGSWIQQLSESPRRPDLRLLDELDEQLPRQKAIRYLTLVLEATVENYNEYRDYNTTTTQSDHGNLIYILLDFLRLRSRYERVCWNLKPVVWAHEILVRDSENGVARMWRRSLNDRVGPEADKFLARLERLRKKYSVRMETVGRRLEERFGHPMQIDRLRALVSPAMLDPTSKKCQRTFELLQHEAQAFSRKTMGVGMDLPGWLAALEREVDECHHVLNLKATYYESQLIEPIQVPIAQLKEQLEQFPRRQT